MEKQIIFNNKIIGLILDRKLAAEDLAKYKQTEEINENIFNEYCETLKRYQKINHELFTYEMVAHLSQFKNDDELFRFDEYIIVKSHSAFLGQGLKLKSVDDHDQR